MFFLQRYILFRENTAPASSPCRSAMGSTSSTSHRFALSESCICGILTKKWHIVLGRLFHPSVILNGAARSEESGWGICARQIYTLCHSEEDGTSDVRISVLVDKLLSGNRAPDGETPTSPAAPRSDRQDRLVFPNRIPYISSEWHAGIVILQREHCISERDTPKTCTLCRATAPPDCGG